MKRILISINYKSLLIFITCLFLLLQLTACRSDPKTEESITSETGAEDNEITTITLAAFWLDRQTKEAIINFNRTNNNYHIQVKDYSEYDTDDDHTIGLKLLSTEIIAGNIPDILDITGLPVEQYIVMGLLEDLYPFIDNDPIINRDDFLDNVFNKAEIKYGLYYIRL